MKTIIENFERQEQFEHFNNKDNPFSYITIKLDITNVYNYYLKHKNLYAMLMYVFTKAINRVDNFKYLFENGKIVKYDVINPSSTIRLNNGNLSFVNFDMEDNFEDFLKNYENAKAEFAKKQEMISIETKDRGSVWYTCLPWFKITGATIPFDRDLANPQMLWDKYEIEGEKVFINLMIMAHHGFVDGIHFAKLIECINEEIRNIK